MIPSTTMSKWRRAPITRWANLRGGMLLRLFGGQFYGHLDSVDRATKTLTFYPIMGADPVAHQIATLRDVEEVHAPGGFTVAAGDIVYEDDDVKVGVVLDHIDIERGPSMLGFAYRPATIRRDLRSLPRAARRAVMAHLRRVAAVVHRPQSVTEARRRASGEFVRSVTEESGGGYCPAESDTCMNDSMRELVRAFETGYGGCILGKINAYNDEERATPMWAWDGGLVCNFGADFVVPRMDRRLLRLIRDRQEATYTGTVDDKVRVDAIFARLEEIGGTNLTWS